MKRLLHIAISPINDFHPKFEWFLHGFFSYLLQGNVTLEWEKKILFITRNGSLYQYILIPGEKSLLPLCHVCFNIFSYEYLFLTLLNISDSNKVLNVCFYRICYCLININTETWICRKWGTWLFERNNDLV